jgi:dienelactone hydrolase
VASTNDTHTSAACCDAPISRSASKYSARGTLHSIVDTSCYISGSSDASKAIFFIYDVFGLQNPTWQGADILAAAGYLVIMPDFFDGEAAKVEWMDLPDEEKKAKLGSWMGKIADAKPHIARIHRILDAAKARYPSVQGWGAIGCMCRGKFYGGSYTDIS